MGRKWARMDSNHRRCNQQIYSLPHLTALVLALVLLPRVRRQKLSRWGDSNPRPRDYKSRALARLSYIGKTGMSIPFLPKRTANIQLFFE